MTDLRNYKRGSGLINWIIKIILQKNYSQKKLILNGLKKGKDFIKNNNPKNYSDLRNFGSVGMSLQRWIYFDGGGRKKYFQDEKIYWNMKLAKEFIDKHKPKFVKDLRKIKFGWIISLVI